MLMTWISLKKCTELWKRLGKCIRRKLYAYIVLQSWMDDII